MRTATRLTLDANTSISESTNDAASAIDAVKTAATSFVAPSADATTTLATAARTARRASSGARSEPIAGSCEATGISFTEPTPGYLPLRRRFDAGLAAFARVGFEFFEPA